MWELKPFRVYPHSLLSIFMWLTSSTWPSGHKVVMAFKVFPVFSRKFLSRKKKATNNFITHFRDFLKDLFIEHQIIDSTWTVNFQMFKLDIEKAEEPEIKLPTYTGSSKKQESSRKTSISALLTMPKPLTVWITINWKIRFKNLKTITWKTHN